MSKSKALVRLPLTVFLSLMFFTTLVWNFYLRSDFYLERALFGYGIFFFGTLLSLVAGLATLSLEARRDQLEQEIKRLAETEKQQRQEEDRSQIQTQQFYDSCRRVFSTVDLPELLQKIVELMGGAFQADEGSLMMLDEEGMLTIAASHGLNREIANKVSIRVGEGISGRAVAEKQEFLINGNLQNYPLFRQQESNPLIKSAIVCPIVYQDEVIGVLNINRTQEVRQFDRGDLRNAVLFSSLVGQAIRNVQLYEDLKGKMNQIGSLASTVDMEKPGPDTTEEDGQEDSSHVA